MAKNCGQEEDYFLDIIHEGHADWYLDYKEAKRHKIANHDHIPTMKITANVKFEIE